MSKRIFDRNSYSQKTIVTFEILAAYFVDIYYNHLYIEAKKQKIEKSVSSITDGYKHALNAYINGIENPKVYKKTLVGIHDYFVASGFNNMNFYECIDRITKEFIPQDYYETVSKQQKISILKLIICQSNKLFLEKIVRKFLELIIDFHDDVDNIRVLQDEYINILMLERETMYHRFITKGENKSNANTRIVESMQHEIKTLLNEKFELKKLVTNLKKIIIKKDSELREEKKYSESLLNNSAELTHELNELKLCMKNVSAPIITPTKIAIVKSNKDKDVDSYFIDRESDIVNKQDESSGSSGSNESESNESEQSFVTHKSKYYEKSPLEVDDLKIEF